VAADGATSAVRSLLGLPVETRDYQQQAIVTAVACQRSLQGVAYERFLPTGPLALLPKPRLADAPEQGHTASLVWTLPSAEAVRLQALPETDFLATAQQAFGERVGRFLALGQRVSWPLARSLSPQPQAPRVLLCGNAAQSLHPVAAQGFNLGLRDVAVLADALLGAAARGNDLGSDAVLSAYSKARAPDRQRTADFTDQLVRVFSNQLPLLAQLRHWGLLALELSPALRGPVLRQNLGHRGLAL
jgi:2-octaprenyl-6-methoxyphenol hydroxylase